MFRKNRIWQPIRVIFITAIMPLIVLDVASAADRYAIKGSMVNVRSGPGTNYDVIYQAEKYYPVILLSTAGNWYQIEDYEGDIGWIHKSLVSKISTVITTKSKCNIRSGPSIKHQVLFIAEKGVPFKVLNNQGSWIHVEHSDGHKGWIHKSLVW